MTSLYDALKRYERKKMISFHTPGHKNNLKILTKKMFKFDYTELPDTDNLYNTTGPIKNLEDQLSKIYGTKRTIISTNGCTLCIQSMLKLAMLYGNKIISSRMIHKSAVNAMALLDAQVTWIPQKFNYHSGCFDPVDIEVLKYLIKNNAEAKIIYITSPDYYGNISDVKEISKICKDKGLILLVDNAHGSHLKFLSKDVHPVTLGADLVADSAHKTLPVLTGGAFLHIANEKFVENAKNEMSIFGSTSPSYPIMASIDLCQQWLSKSAKLEFLKLENSVKKIKIIAKKMGILPFFQQCDPTRITLNTSKIGVSGIEVAEYFRKNKIEPEFADRDHVVFIPTPMNTKKDLSKLKKTIKNIKISNKISPNFPMFENPITKISLHDALFSKSRSIETKFAENKVSASTVCPCPPGIPILLPGELITKNSIQNLLYYGIFSVNVVK